ncbi:MAG: citrate (Si)-synthase [Verrucomicrobia bacterium 21-51-4]|nr:MAG: citrate (Si)-synthase [Verrucomicrobia bacterium 21-51-4]HQU08474.1 citrate synthase [Opitutales bacterium]
MDEVATLRIGSQNFDMPVIVGSEGEHAVDIRQLRDQTGFITYDDSYGNTGSCLSDITFIDGEKGILRHRGYPIEELAASSTFIETAYLIIYGELPDIAQLQAFSDTVLHQGLVHESLYALLDGYSAQAHPMAVLSGALNALGTYHPQLASNNRAVDNAGFNSSACILMAQIRTLAAMAYRKRMGLPKSYPNPGLGYAENFLQMLFSKPYRDYMPHPDVAKAMDLIFLLHADHEQNCSTSTVRMVCSGGANPFACVSAAVCALWGPLHGGANMAVIDMLQQIYDAGDDGSAFIDAAHQGKAKLMGFGHRVYKNYDPRAKILKETSEKVFKALGIADPLLDIAMKLEERALNDDYFISRKLYPNVDFYSGIILRAMGIPLEMFTVIFAIGRMPGWLANWREVAFNPKARIHRPRQVYTGPALRSYLPMSVRS